MEQTKKPLPGAVLLLAALGFVLGTCEFVIVGILPEIAEGLNTSLAAVGKLGCSSSPARQALPLLMWRCCMPPG